MEAKFRTKNNIPLKSKMTIFFAVIALAFLVSGIFFSVINYKHLDMSDLQELELTISDHVLIDLGGAKRRNYEYEILADTYENYFLISSQHIQAFDSETFENEVQIGTTIKIYILKTDYEKIKGNYQGRLEIQKLCVQDKDYLSLDNINEINKSGVIIGIGLGILSLIVFGKIILLNLKSKKPYLGRNR